MRDINEADGYLFGVKPRPRLIDEFKKLISKNGLHEGRYQEFLEEHPEFLMQPFLLNHQLHFDAIISQFRLNTDITADFCYLTKSTCTWWVVLIEIERPEIPLFLSKKKRLIQTAEFTERLAQIQEWKDAVSESRDQIIARVESMRRPLGYNPVYFKYVLIIGRDPVGREKESWRRIDQ